MKYETTSDLPRTLRETMPLEAQEVYLNAYNEAWETAHVAGNKTLSRESIAHQVAWDTVNRQFVHDEKTGQWYREGEAPLLEEEKEQKTFWGKLKSLVR